MPRHDYRIVHGARAVSYLAQEQFRPKPGAVGDASATHGCPTRRRFIELMDQYKTPDQSRRVATVILAGGVFGRPLVGPAGIPPERLKILRSAVASALKDPELKAEAEKRNYELDPVGGEEMQRLAKEVMSQPPAVIERMRKVLGE